MGDVCLAIDIGGTKLACGLVTSNGELVVRDHVATPSTTVPGEILGQLLGLVASVRESATASPTRCGIGCGGPMENGGVTVSPLNIPAWREFPLASAISKAVDLPVAIDNDAKALALAEGWVGAASDVDSFLAMVVSTGVGGGIVLNGRLLNGRQGNAGHIGHMVVVPGGRLCRCGVRGCLEAEASGTAIQAITGRPPKEADAAMVERCGELVGRAVADVVTLLDLSLCVIAGSVALGYGQPFFNAAQASLDRSIGLSFTRGARIIPAGLGDEGPLVGAAAVGFRDLALETADR